MICGPQGISHMRNFRSVDNLNTVCVIMTHITKPVAIYISVQESHGSFIRGFRSSKGHIPEV